MHQSLAVLDKMVAEKGGQLHFSLPLEANGFLGMNLANGFRVSKGIPLGCSTRCLDRSRGKTLTRPGPDFVFTSAIFGDNTTIVVGHQNTQQVKNTKSVAGDF